MEFVSDWVGERNASFFNGGWVADLVGTYTVALAGGIGRADSLADGFLHGSFWCSLVSSQSVMACGKCLPFLDCYCVACNSGLPLLAPLGAANLASNSRSMAHRIEDPSHPPSAFLEHGPLALAATDFAAGLWVCLCYSDSLRARLSLPCDWIRKVMVSDFTKLAE